MEETEFHMTLIVNESFFCAITFSFTQILIWNFVELFTNMYQDFYNQNIYNHI